MSWRKSWLEAMAAKKHARNSTHADDIERLEADMAAYLVKGGTIKPAVSAPRVTITERQRKVKI